MAINFNKSMSIGVRANDYDVQIFQTGEGFQGKVTISFDELDLVIDWLTHVKELINDSQIG